ncbi:MAG TPA: HAD family phosphatase [Baekduia sp.]|nr:HAD family phosphatase [Baekduia sp.]
MISTVVSDFGGVLTTPLVDAFAEVQSHYGIQPEDLGSGMAAVMRKTGKHPLYEMECGRLSEPEFMRMLGDEVGKPLHEFSERYFAALRTNHEMLDLLREAREAGFRLAMLTNNVREWEPRWRAMLPVDELFEDVVDSAYVGMRKPDAEIYELTCSRLRVAPQECLFIDDIEVNCIAAREAGMHAVWFLTTEQAAGEVRAALGLPDRARGT